jgi:hypothetical protein
LRMAQHRITHIERQLRSIVAGREDKPCLLAMDPRTRAQSELVGTSKDSLQHRVVRCHELDTRTTAAGERIRFRVALFGNRAKKTEFQRLSSC